MADKYILDENGNPVPCPNLILWGKWLEKADRRIAETNFPRMALLVWLGKLFKTKHFEPVRVSTVFLGLDHRLFSQGPPLLFETMIFGGKHDQYERRYTTKEDAQVGYFEIVWRLKAGTLEA